MITPEPFIARHLVLHLSFLQMFFLLSLHYWCSADGCKVLWIYINIYNISKQNVYFWGLLRQRPAAYSIAFYLTYCTIISGDGKTCCGCCNSSTRICLKSINMKCYIWNRQLLNLRSHVNSRWDHITFDLLNTTLLTLGIFTLFLSSCWACCCDCCWEKGLWKAVGG